MILITPRGLQTISLAPILSVSNICRPVALLRVFATGYEYPGSALRVKGITVHHGVCGITNCDVMMISKVHYIIHINIICMKNIIEIFFIIFYLKYVTDF